MLYLRNLGITNQEVVTAQREPTADKLSFTNDAFVISLLQAQSGDS